MTFDRDYGAPSGHDLWWTTPLRVDAAITTAGGHLQILEVSSASPALQWESLALPANDSNRDLGYGGLALACGDLDGVPGDEVVYASLFGASDAAGAGGMSSRLSVVRFDGSSYGAVQHIDVGALMPGDSRFTGFGVCGIAIGDLTDTESGNEVVVTTLNGEMYVFRSGSGGSLELIHASVHTGALGVSNSIVIADIDDDPMAPEGAQLYVSSTQGLYRFNVGSTGQ